MRKQKKYHYIYKTTNLLNGKYYIGMHSTDNLGDAYMGSGKRLRYSINKHGKDNHQVEILEFVDTREELKARETEIVNLNEIAKIDCMNLKVGGEGGGRFWSEAHRIKAQVAGAKAIHKRLENDEEFKKEFSNKVSTGLLEAYKNGSKTPVLGFKDKKHSEETKEKMRKSKNVGSVNSQYGKCWITNESENKKIKKSDEVPNGWRLGRVIK